jgi:purine-nucleoside phosphorylase
MNLKKLKDAIYFKENYDYIVSKTSDFLKKELDINKTEFGISFGSGLGEIEQIIEKEKSISYKDIPNFQNCSVSGHEGKLIKGKIEGVDIIALKGRVHYYEVADELLNNGILKVVFPIHVLANLNVKNYFVTNASGGLNLSYGVGDLMIITSHINNIFDPLMGRKYYFSRVDNNKDTERFQNMSKAYNKEYIELFSKANIIFKDNIHKGVYLGLTGPSYETEAESIFYRNIIKADVVGMSTTPEVIIARNRGMNVIGLSCITNKISNDGTNNTNHNEVESILKSEKIKNRISTSIKEFFNLYKKEYNIK